jgi:flagella basal body P-ring formation protein FlgA
MSLLALFTALAAAAAQPPVLAHDIERGAILGASDFVDGSTDAVAVTGGIEATAAVGLEAVRRLSAGHVVHGGDVMAPRLVRRGEPVTVRARAGALTITTTGRALADGRKGENIRVVVAATSRTVDGLVEGSGTVRVSIAD